MNDKMKLKKLSSTFALSVVACVVIGCGGEGDSSFISYNNFFVFSTFVLQMYFFC